LKIAIRSSRKMSEEQLVRVLLEAVVGHLGNLPALTPKMTKQLPKLSPLIKSWKKKSGSKAKKDLASVPAQEIGKSEEDAYEQESVSVPEEEGIFVERAGLVLLHPFLSTLFTRLQLTQNRRLPGYR
jgi:hypothetical protein